MRHYSFLLRGPFATVALACASTLLACAAIELGYRAHTGQPVFVLDNWRASRIEYQTFGERTIFDPVLGWVPMEWYEAGDNNTLKHGIRRNFEEDEVRSGAILAVGSLFTDGGTDVGDNETWPAQLAVMADTPVLNAGVGGYATDQIVLRAEQLLPLVKPNTLIVGFVEEDIFAAGHSSFGLPKPYFTLDGDELKYHPPVPVVLYDATTPAWQARARAILGYSAVLDVVMDHLAPNYWTGTAGQRVFRKIDNDPVGITCALLQRLKTRTDAGQVRLLLFMQHRRQTIVEKQEPGEDAKKVAQCATTMRIDVVDQFESLRALAVANSGALRDFYLQDADALGLMSAKGNRHAAELLARTLGKR